MDVEFIKSQKVELLPVNQAKLLFDIIQIDEVLLEKLLPLQLMLRLILF